MDLEKMNKKELVKVVESLQQQVLDLQVQLEKSKNGEGRKSQVLELLRTNATMSIIEIANEIGISAKNVSSQLTYLRNDGYAIFTDPNGRKLLVEKKKEEEEVVEEVVE